MVSRSTDETWFCLILSVSLAISLSPDFSELYSAIMTARERWIHAGQGNDVTAEPIPRAAYVLTGCVGVIGSNSLVLGPIAPEVSRSLGAAVPTVMMAAAAFGLGTAASALFLARYIDRFGPRRMLRLALGSLAVALLLSAVAPVVAALVAAQLVAGMASGVALPAIYAGAAAMAPPGRESRTIGVVLIGWTLSMVAGVSLSAVLADFIHWRAVYGAVALLAVFAVAALSWMLPREEAAARSAPMPLSALGLLGIKPLLFGCFAFMTAFYGIYGYLGDHLRHGLGQPVSANGLAALVYGIGFGSAPLFDGMVHRIGARRLLPIVLLAVSAIYFLLALASSSFGAMLVVLASLGLANHFGVNLLIVRLTAIDSAQRGTILGLNSAVTYLAVSTGTASFGPLYSTYGFATAAYAAMALALTATMASAWHPRT
ncbi:MFS transporter [Pendulispora brunnea]|uniref:MFS transporter n=1 Tax=Pendulispora brunnea TaxID=2905690 RepID=A0ABZ2JZW0_9BACT